MLRHIFAGLALALLTIATPAYAADQDAAPGPPAWQLPMLAAGGGLALGMLVRGWKLGAGGWGRKRQASPQPPATNPHPGLDAPTERRPRPGERRDQPGYRLVAWSGERRIVYELRGRQCVIGRDPGCDLQIDDPGVAGLHARVSLAGRQVTLTDLDSPGGTSLSAGGPPLTAHQPAALRDGDEFWLGREVRVALRQSGEG